MVMLRSDLTVAMIGSLLAIFFAVGLGARGISESTGIRSFNKTTMAFMESKGRQVAEKSCSKSYITIAQAPTDPLPNGTPAFLVQISNDCPSNCGISKIHVSCGMFSSAVLVPRTTFWRIAVNDCLVNAGRTLSAGQVISFKYANSFKYPMSVTSLVCN